MHSLKTNNYLYAIQLLGFTLLLDFPLSFFPPEIDSMLRRVPLHTQYTGYEGAAYNQGDPPQPCR